MPLGLSCWPLATDLTPETAARLKVAWTYQTKAAPPNQRAAQIAAFEATPTLAGGLLYLITPFNQAIALDPHAAGGWLRGEPLGWQDAGGVD